MVGAGIWEFWTKQKQEKRRVAKTTQKVSAIKTHTESSKSELFRGGKGHFKVWLLSVISVSLLSGVGRLVSSGAGRLVSSGAGRLTYVRTPSNVAPI